VQGEVPASSAASREAEHGGVTLFDLVLIISGGWALPYAVVAALGTQSAWRVPAYLAGGVGGLFWGWYCKKFEWFAYKKILEQKGKPVTASSLPFTTALGIYLGVLGLSLLLQYALYRIIRFGLGIVLHSS